MAAETAKSSPVQESNVKETVESILVAFILAFIFRAFVVEAFVIPTGSMAPTLYGAHMRFRCPDCGTSFDTGFSVGENADIPTDAFRPTDYHCPNCGYTFKSTDAAGANVAQRVRFGDRILVLKYIYLFEKPQRGDTVVFKSPASRGSPTEAEYSVNFIKRLVGIGPETIVLLDGDVYVGPAGSRDPAAFKIWRKPPHVQDVLWRTVYDNDFIPHLADSPRTVPWMQPWQTVGAQTGWDLGVGGRSRVFNFNGTSPGMIAFNDRANPDTHALTDFLVYDEREHNSQQWEPRPVSDLRLACTYTRKTGDGPLRLQLTKLADCFTAEVRPGKIVLLRSKVLEGGSSLQTGPEQVVMEKSMPDLKAGSPARIELTNVDYSVKVRVNGQDAFPSFDYDPDVPALWNRTIDPNARDDIFFARPRIRITADNQQSAIEHVQLARDIYYLSLSNNYWANPGRPVDLKSGEYFVLGDNSFISGDARYWNEPIVLPQEGMDHVESGRVPEQFMLGKAFFVYWPAGYTVPYTGMNIVPDFGDMRFIH